MNAADTFCELLRLRPGLLQHQQHDLSLLGAVYRCDPLFEAGADFSDTLSLYEQGVVGESVMREGALRCAVLAAQVYWATVAHQRRKEEGLDDGRDGGGSGAGGAGLP